MHSIAVFLESHPAIFTALLSLAVYQPLSAIFTTIFRLQPDDVYARFALKHPALARVWRIAGALGIDPVKALQVTQELIAVLTAPKIPENTDDKDTLQ